MRWIRLLLSGLAIGSPLLASAQATAPTPRYYVGLALYASPYQPLRGGGGYLAPIIPFQAVAGYQLRPRLAVQLGVAYSSSEYSYFDVGKYFPVGGPARGVFFETTSHGTSAHTSVALLGRYQLTRQPSHRLQVDLLGGVTLENTHYTRDGTYTDSTQVPISRRYDESGSSQAYLLTAGPSVRCRLGRHLEALLDFTLNYDFNRDHHVNSSELTGATALGLRYRFGGLR